LAKGIQQSRVAVIDLVPFKEAGDGAAVIPQPGLGLALDEKVIEPELLRVFEAFGEAERLRVFLGSDEEPSELDNAFLVSGIQPIAPFFKFPPEEWQALRTTNIIERLNKEFKRRTNSMEIVAEENACYRLLAFISLKMEMHWKRNPIGKAAFHLPIFQRVPLGEFIQNA
jgi:hypothetical protein